MEVEKRIGSLSKSERSVFEQIALNNDFGLSFRAVKPLIELGLVELIKTRRGMWTDLNYRVPLSVHAIWCGMVSDG